ncbi:MAG: glucans biosynthesis glucosyltransferase MdoH [Candidatus Adiutrix sp.]|jgi:membrane glycosyltransferase|nr:glucans biosynthesis glucosyltransferase MdoH [Candidatus Adiutrix sp.]
MDQDNTAQKVWKRVGDRRRLVLLALVLVPSWLAADVLYSLLPARSWPGVNLSLSLLFAVLFAWISVGFWTSLLGTLVLLRRYDRFAATGGLPSDPGLPDDFRTALLFPVYNENARDVAAGLSTVLQSLRAGNLDRHFDLFILSDSTRPDVWAAEEEVWHDLCRREKAFGRIFYRHRKSNLKRKSGNIADFCRRWGAGYRYLAVFDADSLLTGETLAKMVQIMERRPEIGILQTPPKAIFSRTLLARVQQFANHLYGPIFAAGLHFWQLGDAQYWGHNAIIRTAPFIEHCQLPKLPGRPPLGGEILSHDFVESALMRRAGYGVWLAYELGGSYEQNPPTLIDELVRDRRWCQGNLQHSRLVFTRGFFPTHRALFVNGIMSYGSALLWFFFLLAGSLQALSALFITPDYFPQGRSLFPDWPQYFPTWALALLSGTAGLLLLPKVMAVGLLMVKGGAGAFGGPWKVTLSVLGEIVVSTFLAPVRMIFHSFFVVSNLAGLKVGWNAQNRGDSGSSWPEALRFHWWGTALGLVWGFLTFFFSPGFFVWLSPVVAGLVFSIPLSVWTGRVSLGRLARRLGLFLTPAETGPLKELRRLEENLKQPEPYCPFALPWQSGFLRAAVIPRVFALHQALAFNRRRNPPPKEARLKALLEKALSRGPGSLNDREKSALLNDPRSLGELHREVWRLPAERARDWGIF